MQIVICGLGGQGALFLSRVLARAGRDAGRGVMVGETHGMSQRGGSVCAFVKLGDYRSSLIREGAADTVLCLAASQAAAGVVYLRRGAGIAIAATDPDDCDPAVTAFAETRGLDLAFVDAQAVAERLSAPKGANVALLGFAAERCAGLPSPDVLAAAISAVSPPAIRDHNLQVFAAGRAAAAREVTSDA